MRLLSFFRKSQGVRSGTTKVAELEQQLRDNGWERSKHESPNEYQYVWTKQGQKLKVCVNYRFGATGEAYAWLIGEGA